MTDAGVAGPDARERLSASEVHDVLRNDRRRLVVERLRTAGTPETVSDLAEHVGGIEAGESPPPRKVRQSVYVSLHQTHLPKLDELGIVDYDHDGKTVEPAANADDLRAYLDAGSGDNGLPPAYYVGLGLLGGAALLGVTAGVPGLRAVGAPGVGFGLSATLVALAVFDVRAWGGSIGIGAD